MLDSDASNETRRKIQGMKVIRNGSIGSILAGERVMESVIRFAEGKLGLKMYREKVQWSTVETQVPWIQLSAIDALLFAELSKLAEQVH